jgi:hypothetical protein
MSIATTWGRRGPAGGVVFALVIAILLTFACGRDDYEEDDNQFRPSVLHCEEALARLVRCCPGFDPSVVECEYFFSRDEGCGATTVQRVEPAFALDESQCILDTGCDDLVARQVCSRAQRARTRCGTASTGPGSTDRSNPRCPSGAAPTSAPQPPVCP